jgi:mRNA-degrading endonuclease RelE of RelBE toxin-antitoxin system
MFEIKFTPRGQKDLERLSKDIQIRIIKKLKFFSIQKDPFVFSKPLINLPPTTHRFRVGDYRITFYVDKECINIDRIRHRKEVYYLEIE